jgi:hypothetical protein
MTPEHFESYELLPQSLWTELNDQGKLSWLWPMLFDARVFITCDRLRHRYGPMTVNNWHWGGGFNDRGFRTHDSTTGGPLSQHRFGRAVDAHWANVEAQEVRDDIKQNPHHPAFEFITRVEEFPGMTWFHFDVADLSGVPSHLLHDGRWWFGG